MVSRVYWIGHNPIVRNLLNLYCSAMDKQAAERREDAVFNAMDRISELPQAILHHILYFLSQKEAIQTCVLSKSWRYLWCSRPNVEFRESYFGGNKAAFMSVLDQTLIRYRDEKLSIQDFILEMSEVDSESISLLEKWIPVVIVKMGVKMFDLSFVSKNSPYFDLPSVVFESESLEYLSLQRCKLNQINSIDKVRFKHLHTLYLDRVIIAEETLEKIVSVCPLIDCLTLHRCKGLRTIKVNKPRNIKYFKLSDCKRGTVDDDDLSIEIDVPTLETIHIVRVPNWYHHNKYFPHLKYLYLHNVRLSTKSFDFFTSNYLPGLEELELFYCYGFEEFQLLSRSIKNLKILRMLDASINRAVIDAPNLVNFFYGGDIPRSAISFTTTSSKWNSYILVMSSVDSNYDALPWFIKLSEMLKALSQSEIFLSLLLRPVTNQHIEEIDGDLCEPVDVWYLCLRLSPHLCSSSAFINNLFRICRPRNIDPYWYSDSRNERETLPEDERERGHKQLTEFLWKTLVMEREKRHYFWQQDLEEVSMEASDENRQKWRPIQRTSLIKCASLLPYNQDTRNVRFRLKWRKLS